MLVELVTVRTHDEVDLDGALYAVPTSVKRKGACLVLHGLTWNFYHRTYALAPSARRSVRIRLSLAQLSRPRYSGRSSESGRGLGTLTPGYTRRYRIFVLTRGG